MARVCQRTANSGAGNGTATNGDAFLVGFHVGIAENNRAIMCGYSLRCRDLRGGDISFDIDVALNGCVAAHIKVTFLQNQTGLALGNSADKGAVISRTAIRQSSENLNLFEVLRLLIQILN